MNFAKIIGCFIYIYGFLKEFRVGQPFLFNALTDTQWRNYTSEQIVEEFFPCINFATIGALVVVFFITDCSQYKFLLFISGFAGVFFTTFYTLEESDFTLLLVNAGFYGIFFATDLVYYAFIYAANDPKDYQTVTAYAVAATLGGKSLSAFIAQFLVTPEITSMNFYKLNYVSVPAMALLMLIVASGFLLPVPTNVYFPVESQQSKFQTKLKNCVLTFCKNLKDSLSDKYVIKWCLWSALSTAGFVQVNFYIQPFWVTVDGAEDTYNGLVEGFLGLVGVSAALLTAFNRVKWTMEGDLVLALMSLFQGFMLLLMASNDDSIILSFIYYVVYGIIYYFTYTSLMCQIARRIQPFSWGMIFALNRLFAAIVNVIMCAVIVSQKGFGLEPVYQFMVYGFYHVFITVVYIIVGLVSWYFKKTYE